MVRACQPALESLGDHVKIQISGPHPQFLAELIWCKAICISPMSLAEAEIQAKGFTL